MKTGPTTTGERSWLSPNHHDKGGPMVMATQTVPPSLPVGNQSVVLWTLTRQKAIKAIQEQLRAQGERLSYIPIRDIRVFADAYFAEHRRELIEVTKAIVSE